MTFKAAIDFLYAKFSRAFSPKHVWRRDDGDGMRMCSVCGRKEELDVDLMNTSWVVIDLGDAGAHAARAGRGQAPVSDGAGLALAREQPPPLQRRA